MIGSVLFTSGVILVLLLLNGLYVASEFAIIGTRRSQLEMLARRGSAPAARMLKLLSSYLSLDRAIATLQVGITVVSLALGMYGEHAVARSIEPLLHGIPGVGPAAGITAHALATVLAVAVLTFLHIVIGEVIPKTIALQDPARTAIRVERPMRLTRWIAYPFVVSLAAASRLVLVAIGIDSSKSRDRTLKIDEIESIIEESTASGALHTLQASLLARLVNFEDFPIRKVMVPRNRVVGLPLNANHESIRRALLATKHSRYPVFREDLDDIVGYVHVKDLMRAEDLHGGIDLASVVRSVPTLPETAHCAALLREFRRRRIHLAVAVDEHGGTAGIVTLEDLVEEIFGPVQDEFDAEETPIRRLGERVAVSLGVCRLDEINAELDLDLVDDHADTIGGLILKKLGRVARPGDVVRAGEVTLKVEEVDRLAIKRVRIVWAENGGLSR